MQRQNIIFKSGITLVISLLFFASAVAQDKPFKTGLWQGYLQLNDSTSLLFDFEVKYDLGIYTVDFINASERISTNEIAIQKDSVFIKMPVFDSEFKCKISDGALKGVWINHGRKDKNVIPFNAHIKGFVQNCLPCFDCDILGKGNWEATFSPGTKESSKAIGIFENINVVDLQGTFLTETGDYRFLVGLKYDQNFELSCFDGSHAFLFKGKIKGDSIINGHFYSGAHHHETWVAKRNDKFELRNPDSLTYLKSGFKKVDFNFKNLDGKNVSLQDEKFKNKVVIIQIMGSWCPNCMDETKFLAPFYDKYNSKGLEVVALAFERTDDFNKAVSNVQRSKMRFNAKYEFLITMKTGKDQASEALPMLNEVMAFPTTIYIDKKGVVRKIYTGFNGPATGDAHTKFVEETTRFVEKLLAE